MKIGSAERWIAGKASNHPACPGVVRLKMQFGEAVLRGAQSSLIFTCRCYPRGAPDVLRLYLDMNTNTGTFDCRSRLLLLFYSAGASTGTDTVHIHALFRNLASCLTRRHLSITSTLLQ